MTPEQYVPSEDFLRKLIETEKIRAEFQSPRDIIGNDLSVGDIVCIVGRVSINEDKEFKIPLKDSNSIFFLKKRKIDSIDDNYTNAVFFTEGYMSDQRKNIHEAHVLKLDQNGGVLL